MSEISYLQLSKEVGDDDLLKRVESLRDLRLLSLQTDPGSFISQYRDEVDQPIDFWLERHRYPLAEHFVAVVTNRANARVSEINAARFIAFLVLLKDADDDDDQHEARTQDPVSSSKTSRSQASSTVQRYKMEAVHVESAYRGRGICTQLILKAIDWIGQETQKAKKITATIVTTVAEGNISAARLYSKLGFKATLESYIKDKSGVSRLVTGMEYVLD